MTETIPYDLIRQHYERTTPLIFEAASKYNYRWLTPYSRYVDFTRIMTPIEFDAWQAIRCFGLMPLYPQYPVGKYFADFANPVFKITVECDGKEFHQDKEKDRLRDEDFKKLGWTVYRISGADCVRILHLPDYEDKQYADYDENKARKQYQDYYLKTIEGLIRSLHFRYARCTPVHSIFDIGEDDESFDIPDPGNDIESSWIQEFSFRCLEMRKSN